jgi:uncharacterized protein YjdB
MADESPTTIVKWDFSNLSPDSNGGIPANVGKKITVFGANALTGDPNKDYVTGFGGSSTKAIITSGWHEESDSGEIDGKKKKYWEVSFETTGYSNLKLSSKQQGSNTGPKEFKVQYSLDHTNWVDIPNGTITVANNTTTGVLNNLSLPDDTSNQSLVYVRWITTSNTSVNGGTVASAGTNRISEIVVTGVANSNPDPNPGPTPEKTASPNKSRIAFPSLTNVVGSTGAVSGNSQVNVYFADNSLAGTDIAEADGSFDITINNPNSFNRVFITAKENEKTESDKVAIDYLNPGSGGGAKGFKPGDIVFSQIYVNGGNSGAFYNTKFFELYNNTDTDIDLSGWSIAYTSASNMSFGPGQVLSGTIKAHSYFLIAGNKNTNGKDLPVKADVELGSKLNPSGSTGGALVLAQKTAAVSGVDDPDVVDLLAYTNSSTTNFKNPLYWGQPIIASNVGSGTILRKTNVGSDPRVAIGLGNGWFTKDPSKDFVINAPLNPSQPEEVIVRNSRYMFSPDTAKINFVQAGDSAIVIGHAGSVPGSAIVKAYLENNGEVALIEQATAAADGSFSLSFSNPGYNQSVYLTHTDTAQPTAKESNYARVNVEGYNDTISDIGQLHVIDTNGLPINIGYTTTIEGVVTSSNNTLGTEKTNFYIQDATGGINVLDGNAPSANIQVGEKVRITGRVGFTAGLTQFVPTTITLLGTEVEPTAVKVSVEDFTNYAFMEEKEGTLVSFTAKVTNIPSEGPDYNVTVSDEEGHAATVRILDSTGINISSALEVGETYTFTGIVGQSKLIPPYTGGYYLLPRKVEDIKGELQLKHTPLEKAYIGLDIHFKATAKNADSVTLYYKAESEQTYTSLAMLTADSLNYNATLDKASVPAHKFFYYLEATGAGNTVNVGSATQPISVNVVEDRDGPTFYDELPLNGDSVETMHPLISVKMEDPNGVDETSVKMKVDQADVTTKAVITNSSITLTLTSADDLSVGQHTVTVEAKDMLGNPSQYTWSFTVAERFTGGHHYRGSTHNHTNISHDAAGAPEDALKEAIKYKYDWFAFSDHSHDIDANLLGQDSVERKNGLKERTGGADWRLTKDLAKQYTKDGQFVVFPAFEMTSTTWGHSNVFGTDNFIDRKEEGGIYQDLKKYYAWVLTYDNIVAQFNHPDMSKDAFDNFIPYDKKLDQLFTMIEVGNGSGKYGYTNAKKKFFSALDLGWHVAPTYGEDNHDATWGQTKKRTIIVAKDLTQESLLESMRKMRVYFSEDPNFTLDVSASGWYMGSTTDTKELNFNITGSDPIEENPSNPDYSYVKTPSDDRIEKVELITNGGITILEYKPTESTKSFNWQPKVTVVGGQQWFVVRVTQKDGDTVYSAPIWTPEEALSVKVSNVVATDGSMIAGVPANLKAGITNMGSIGLSNLRVKFYVDDVKEANVIGEVNIDSLPNGASTDASIVWENPIAGSHKVVVVLEATDGNQLGENKFEQLFDIRAPLGIKIMIDASHANENTTADTGTYKDNLKTFTAMMRKEAYTIVENKTQITSDVLQDVNILVVTHPATEYTTNEINAIKDFVEHGGSLLLTGKSNYKPNQNPNSLLAGINSSILINDDGVFDESTKGNFWSGNKVTNNFAVRVYPTPVSNGITDFVHSLDYYSGASLAKNDGSGRKAPLTDDDKVKIIVHGNETSFQSNVKLGNVAYSVQSSPIPNPDTLTGGSAIPLVALEEIGQGRIVVSGMNLFNDKQMDQSYEPKGNVPFALKVISWLAHREEPIIKIGDARKLPEGTNVVVEGTVTTAAGVFYDAFYLQDETGGVMAFNEVPEGSLKLGDKVRVYGHIKIFENNTEVEFDTFANSVVKLGSGTPIEPTPLTTAQANAEENQGLLVKVVGKVTSIPDDTSYVINDGSGDVLIFTDGYIINQSGPIPKLKVGDTLEAVGLTGKFAEGNRIRVRDTKELKKIEVVIAVTGVSLDQSNLTLTAGGAVGTLKATITPADATNKVVRWSSSDETVATVDEKGVVTPLKVGTTTITVTTVDGNYEASCKVTVVKPTSDRDPRDDYKDITDNQNDHNLNNNDGKNNKENQKDLFVVQPKEIVVQAGTGKVTITSPTGTKQVILPSNTAELLAHNQLEIKMEKLTLTLSSEIFTQLTNLVKANELKDSSIRLIVNPVPADQAKELLSKGIESSNTQLRLSGEVFEFSLIHQTKDGKQIKLSKFNKPITIRLKVDPDINPRLAGIYHIADNGQLEFIGGKYANGEMVAEVYHFSKYAVLEYKKTFADVQYTHWASAVIQELTAKHVINGTSATTFEPDRIITRAEFTSLIVKALGLQDQGEIKFTDVPSDKWYAQPISIALKAGIVTGKSEAIFDPNAQITRQEMVVMLMRAYEIVTGHKVNGNTSSGFKDESKVASWALIYVREAAILDLIHGRALGQFVPMGITTRAEAAQVIYNLLKN